MRLPSQTVPTRHLSAVLVAMLRVGCAALFVSVGGCGGGAGNAPSSNSVAMPAPDPGSTQLPPAAEPLVVGTALSIDSGATGNPVSLRVARSASGDGFAAWQADDGSRHNLWANRYSAATGVWGSPINIEASSADIDEFDITIDASGNAVVAWHEVPNNPQLESGVVMSARFDTGAGAWAQPVPLNTNAREPRVASDATGAVLAVYVAGAGVVRGRFFDAASGIWAPEAAIEQNFGTNGFGSSFGPAALLDGSGNALVTFNNGEHTFDLIASNYFSRSTGDWAFKLALDQCDILGVVPGSLVDGGNDHLGLAASSGGDFLLAWQHFFLGPPGGGPGGSELRIARFTSSTRIWSEAQTLVPGSAGQNVQFRRNGIGSDAAGNALLIWTETVPMRTALKAIRLDKAGVASSAVQVIDSAVGGSIAQPFRGADLRVDPLGNAIAIWQQFEGTFPNDGSRSNIAMNRFDGATGTWASAVFAEAEPGNAISPSASVPVASQALLGWIQSEGGANRVKAMLQPLTNMQGQ
ncbi:MAG TPA: hypothetical protein VFU71_12880 [Burkholderiaceae bacterium]|nr:hypothetical protein [Burkholderiaceae bacterium]